MSLLDYWDTQRPSAKRRKTVDDDRTPSSRGFESDQGNEDTDTLATPGSPQDGDVPGDDDNLPPSSQTDLESSLPAIRTDNEAIEAYEQSRELDRDELGLHERLQVGRWQKGRSSIYVDAFNLALETVLDEEAHLFNEPEMEVFKQWKELSYESQYL